MVTCLLVNSAPPLGEGGLEKAQRGALTDSLFFALAQDPGRLNAHVAFRQEADI